MSWMTNEMMFYGGIIISVLAVVAAILYFSISGVKGKRLNIKLDAEYGKKDE